MSAISLKISQVVGSGNHVSKSERKVRRSYKINMQKFSFFSTILSIKILITGPCKIIRNVMFYGSFDRYIIHSGSLPAEFLPLRKRIIEKIQFNSTIIKIK